MSRATQWTDDWRPGEPIDFYRRAARRAYAAARRYPRRTLGRALERRTGRMFAAIVRLMAQGGAA